MGILFPVAIFIIAVVGYDRRLCGAEVETPAKKAPLSCWLSSWRWPASSAGGDRAILRFIYPPSIS
ncbi:hypothetical protein MJ561_11870 [Klebsiella pneumoniae]|nr:hypothetical protein MJ561_11870 [Klebsiella pneumoniae]